MAETLLISTDIVMFHTIKVCYKFRLNINYVASFIYTAWDTLYEWIHRLRPWFPTQKFFIIAQ